MNLFTGFPLEKHQRTEADKKHECETCSKRFYRGDALRAHMKSHTQEKRNISIELKITSSGFDNIFTQFNF